MSRTSRWLLGSIPLALLAGGIAWYSVGFGPGRLTRLAFGRSGPAPEIPSDLDWLNTDRPLRLADLKGKVVLLDFWTYCCINCQHVLPDLARLEAKYPDALVVIGVHSAKFDTQRQSENIRQAVLRHDIRHPVVNDAQMRMWKAYEVRAWPTIALIDPAGELVAVRPGEGVFKAFDPLIARLIERFEAKGKVDREPLELALERDREPAAMLSFPGKVLADAASGRLFIADTGDHRLVVARLADGAVLETVGGGGPGLDDGPFAEARFRGPQGLALDGDRLYIADTGNHAVRLVDLAAGTVSTVAGTGEQGRRSGRGGPARDTALSSPWDVLLHDGVLYVAMAGWHQVWRIDLSTGRAEPFAGTGREARIDGPRDEAALAQPSGLAADGRRLYVADSEASAIRAIDLGPPGRVETVVGGDLFDFGDRDGRGLEVRLQHPLGVATSEGVLFVADTYNNKVKRIDLADRTCITWLGTGMPGRVDGPGRQGRFDEPGGLSVVGGKLYVADTNSHAIRVADLETGRIDTLHLQFAGQPSSPGAAAESR